MNMNNNIDMDMQEVQLNYDNAGIPEASNDSMQELVNEQSRLNQNISDVKQRTKHQVDLANSTKQILDAFLKKQSKRTSELHFPSMHGDIDLSILEQHNFTNLHALYFSPGFITQITNIPEQIKLLYVPDNAIERMQSIPESLERLHMSQNQLHTIDLTGATQLKELHVSFNKLKQLERLPRTLNILHCSFNFITDLDLHGIPLHTLYCQHNPRLQLAHVPETIIHGNYENNLIQIDKTDLLQHDYVPMESDYKKKIAEFFQLKKKYEEEKMKALRGANKNILEQFRKRNPRKKTPFFGSTRDFKKPRSMPKCVGCGGEGGMTFEIAEDAYRAQCANNQKCDWTMVIYRGVFNNRERMLYDYHQHLEMLKEMFIEIKMDSLFRYISDQFVKERFEKRTKLYDLYSVHYKQFLDTHTHLFHNDEKKRLIQEKEKEVSAHLEEIKRLLEEEMDVESNVQDTLNSIVKIQCEKIKPLAQYIQRMKYEYMTIRRDEKDSLILIQNETLADKLDTLIDGSMSMEETNQPEIEDNEPYDYMKPIPRDMVGQFQDLETRGYTDEEKEMYMRFTPKEKRAFNANYGFYDRQKSLRARILSEEPDFVRSQPNSPDEPPPNYLSPIDENEESQV